MSGLRNLSSYKNSGRDPNDMRRRRAEDLVGLRKIKKDKDLFGRRHIGDSLADEENPNEISDIGPVPDAATIQSKLNEIAVYINSENTNEVHQGLDLARGMVDWSSHPPLIDELINSGLVPRCIELVRAPDDAVRFEAANVLINITSEKEEHVTYVVEHGAALRLYEALDSQDKDTVGRVLWALGNIVSDSITVRNSLIESGMIERMLKLSQASIPFTGGVYARRTTLDMLRCLCWTTGRLLIGRPSPPHDKITKLITMICRFFGQDDHEMTRFSILGIKNAILCGKQYIEPILKHDETILPRILFLLESEDEEIVKPCANVVSHIVLNGTDEQIDGLLRNGPAPILNALKNLLASKDMQIVKDATNTIGDLSLDPSPIEVIHEAYKIGIIPEFMRLLGMNARILQWPITATLANITARSSFDEIMYLYAQGVNRAFCTLLKSGSPTVVRDALDGIRLMLKISQPRSDGFSKIKQEVEECRGLETIESLQAYENESISSRASQILDEFFTDADAVDKATEMDFMESDCSSTQSNAVNFMSPINSPVVDMRPPTLQLAPPTIFDNNPLPSPFLIPGPDPGHYAYTPAYPNLLQHFTFDNNQN